MSQPNMKNFGKRVRQKRKEKGWSMGSLGKRVGCGASRIWDIENEQAIPEQLGGKILLNLPKALGVSLNWLLTGEERVPTLEQLEEALNAATAAVMESRKLKEKTKLVAEKVGDYTTRTAKELNLIPRVSLIHAGEPVEYNDDNPPEEWIDLLARFKDHKIIALKIEGDSMYPCLADGDIVYIDLEKVPNLNDIAVVKLYSGESFVRKIIHKDMEGYFFQPINPAFKPTMVKKSEVRHICKVLFKEFK